MNKLLGTSQGGAVLKVYPTGRFSQGHLRVVHASDDDRGLAEAYQAAREKLKYDGQLDGIPTASFVQEHIKPPPLGLSKVSNLHREYSTRGRRGLTRYGKRQIEESIALLEEVYGRDRLSFFTGTLPPEVGIFTCEQWTHLIKLFRQRLLAMFALKQLPPYLVGVFEIQTERFKESGQVCLHLHLVFVGRHKRKTWSFTPQELQAVWNRCLNIVMDGSLDESRMAATCNVQRVRKSARAYLGKYISKSCNDIAKVEASGLSHTLPRAWKVISRPLSRLYLSRVIRIVGKDAEAMFDRFCNDADKMLRYIQPIDIELPGGNIWRCGWSGTLTNFGRAIARSVSSAWCNGASVT